ncbi:MAG: hypothetical protein CVV03_02620 [Firmicutes bacterium HGW-Firmicutes-8]|nr:MAG: hypothetical protein CVV03_02620 [Firmicutes bacterium HGW-Firmicutes-8]
MFEDGEGRRNWRSVVRCQRWENHYFFFSLPATAVLKRRPFSFLAHEGLVCSGGPTRLACWQMLKVRGDGCSHKGFPLFPFLRHLPQRLAVPQGQGFPHFVGTAGAIIPGINQSLGFR